MKPLQHSSTDMIFPLPVAHNMAVKTSDIPQDKNNPTCPHTHHHVVAHCPGVADVAGAFS